MGICCSINSSNYDNIREDKFPTTLEQGNVFQVQSASTPLLGNINFELAKDNADNDTSTTSIDDSEIERLIAEEDESDSK